MSVLRGNEEVRSCVSFGKWRSLFMRFWRTRSVHVLLVENKYICSCVSVGEWSLFMCLWWEMNQFVPGFLVGN